MMRASTSTKDEIIDPSDDDILCGKSKSCVNHVGSRRYREYVDTFTERYLQATTKQQKMMITREIYDTLKSRKCRFLRFNKSRATWEEIGPAVARDKISHALRWFADNSGSTSAAARTREASSERHLAALPKPATIPPPPVAAPDLRLGAFPQTHNVLREPAAYCTTAYVPGGQMLPRIMSWPQAATIRHAAQPPLAEGAGRGNDRSESNSRFDSARMVATNGQLDRERRNSDPMDLSAQRNKEIHSAGRVEQHSPRRTQSTTSSRISFESPISLLTNSQGRAPSSPDVEQQHSARGSLQLHEDMLSSLGVQLSSDVLLSNDASDLARAIMALASPVPARSAGSVDMQTQGPRTADQGSLSAASFTVGASQVPLASSQVSQHTGHCLPHIGVPTRNGIRDQDSLNGSSHLRDSGVPDHPVGETTVNAIMQEPLIELERRSTRGSSATDSSDSPPHQTGDHPFLQGSDSSE